MPNGKTHTALLELIKAIDSICAQEKLVYMLTAGTLLGAVREKGFIEWDVDADLMMHRHDYDAFESCSEKYLPSLGLSLRYADRVPRVYRTDNPKCNAEILIIDALPQKAWKRSYKVFMLKLLQGMSKQKIDYRKYSFKDRLLLQATSLLGSFFSEETKRSLYKKLSLLGNEENSEWVFFSNERYRFMNLKIDRSILAEAVRTPFADTELPIPKEWDKFLKIYYGNNYMTPKRENYYK
jgi:lipopolysaccharide cholinephosphotransferase